ncbi:MAG TPA: tetratricopeptide repeat protein [Candidatus Acidoferrum sp.]|nr:tetratricopeptide repeat protein [Candidatus Acidoferrum sp.]
MSNDNLHALAEHAEKKGDWPKAIECFLQIASIEPSNLEALAHLGWCLSRNGSYDEAVTIFQELTSREPSSARWPYMVGFQFHQRQQWAQAVPWFAKALDLNPDYLVVLYRKGYAHFQLKQFGEALRCFEHCRAVWRHLPEGPARDKDRKNCAKAAYHQAEIAIENPRLILDARPAAIRLLEEALELDPSNANAHYMMGKALLDHGRPAEATAAFEAADRLQPGQDYVLDRWGLALSALDRHADAQAVFERIPAPRRKDYVLRHLGQILIKKGDPASASAALREAIRKNSRNHFGHYWLGKCLALMSCWDEARREFRQAVDLRLRYFQVPFPEAQQELDRLIREHPEPLAPVQAQGRRVGKIRRFHKDRGFGFIESEGTTVFFHISDCAPTLDPAPGIEVSYEVKQGSKGPKAVRILRQSGPPVPVQPFP